ncbi:MAG: anhydro-N-acetylmuramic acid kinase [Gammaproteobacteria bacterium]
MTAETPSDYYIGLMSGTSMDGIDAALVDLASGHPHLVDTLAFPWDSDIRHQLEQLASNPGSSITTLTELHVKTARSFSDAALTITQKAGLSPEDITAIGNHGQTILHIPTGDTAYSWQIGDPNRIAEYTRITTVCDFRNRDIAAGGQGAPLVPAFHQKIFQATDEFRVVVNIGGIANITLLPVSPSLNVTGFDTGPGNLLLNAWCRKHTGKPYDNGGDWARQGETNDTLLDTLLSDPYFSLPAPKSTGREYFNLLWLEKLLASLTHSIPPVHVQATLVELTSTSISNAIHQQTTQCDRLLVCGGGIHNRYLIERINAKMANCTVESTEPHGLHPDWVEATAFAWLAQQTINHQPGNLPTVTGATHPVILGGVYRA